MSKEERIAKAFGEYDGRMEMIRLASEEMFRNLPVNEAGETSAEALLELNQWVERMKKNTQDRLAKAFSDLDK